MSYSQQAIREYLHPLGYCDPEGSLEAEVAAWQATYAEDLNNRCQLIHGRPLKVDGLWGPACEELMQTPRCGCSDILPMLEATNANWPQACRGSIKVHHQPEGLRMASGNALEAFKDALDSWEDVIDVGFDWLTDRKGAMIWSSNGPLSGSVLAWSYLATGNCASVLEQRYNSRLTWDQQYLQAVVAHEHGHALGLPHTNDPSALMYPYARENVFKPAAKDVSMALSQGYNPADDDGGNDDPADSVVSVKSRPDGIEVEWQDGFVEFFPWRKNATDS